MSRALLYDGQRRELTDGSGIDPTVIAERGYRAIARPTATNDGPRNELRNMGIPKWVRDTDAAYPMLYIPWYGPAGGQTADQVKPRRPLTDREGKQRKYVNPGSKPLRLDVHPRNSRVPNPADAASIPPIRDVRVPLWITEGIKKADALTSRGACVVALNGVYTWRSTQGTLGDWEDILLRGRDVIICFDADARTNTNVQRAMQRLGAWLRSRGAKTVRYIVVPAEFNGIEVKGADDYFVAGGTLTSLVDHATVRPPVEMPDGNFTDTLLAESLVDDALRDRFLYTGNGWYEWDGTRWRTVDDVIPQEAVRQYFKAQYDDAAARVGAGSGSADELREWVKTLALSRQTAVLRLARGLLAADAADMDQEHDLLNTPSGVVHLPSGELLPHDPARRITKITAVPYDPDAEHADWTRVLEAVPVELHDWLRRRLGQSITGHPTPDDRLIVTQGGGENGKTTLFHSIASALGYGYYVAISDRVLLANPGDHPTELMDLQGARVAVIEETPEARRLDVNRLKKTVGTPTITARRMRRDDVTFKTTHTLWVTTNHRPGVSETDHGTWRRLLLLRFPYTFRKPGQPLVGPHDRHGDPTLRMRVARPEVAGAVLAWLVRGAQEWYADPDSFADVPPSIELDTLEWRRSADVILDFLSENIVFDRNAHIPSTDLYHQFTMWLDERGMRGWSDKTFTERFGEHDEVTGHAVAKLRPKTWRTEVSVRTSGQLAGRYAGWAGVRWATDHDQEPDDLAVLIQDHVPTRL